MFILKIEVCKSLKQHKQNDDTLIVDAMMQT